GRETGKNLVKGEEIERENRRCLVSALMTNQGIVIIGRIGTTEIVTGTERGIGKETGVVRVVSVAGTVSVAETVSVIGSVNVIVTVLERGRGRRRRIMKLRTSNLIEGVPVIESMIMIE
ncbi:hypothetical protein ACR2V0_28845, partial [Klebsiella pneumoniae]